MPVNDSDYWIKFTLGFLIGYAAISLVGWAHGEVVPHWARFMFAMLFARSTK